MCMLAVKLRRDLCVYVAKCLCGCLLTWLICELSGYMSIYSYVTNVCCFGTMECLVTELLRSYKVDELIDDGDRL